MHAAEGVLTKLTRLPQAYLIGSMELGAKFSR
jgi:hypothetical protein